MLLLVGFSVLSMAADNRTDIHSSAEEVQPLLVGMEAPDFTLRDVENQAFSFTSGTQAKPIVDIWFISIDKPELLLESLNDPDIGYTVYSDSALSATRVFGLAFRVDDELNERYLSHDIDLEKASGENHHVLPAPATYIIGTDGIINFAYINPDYKVRLHPDVLLAAATAYTEEADKRLVSKRKQASK